MDTREKIIGREKAAAVAGTLRAAVVTGYFDVLLAAHVRRLRELRDNASALVVIVRDPPRPLLSTRARCELLAALEVVDYVIPAGEDEIADLLARFTSGEITHEEAADERRARELLQHVQRRHETGAGR